MDDTISRAAAIDALADYIHNVDKVLGTGRLTAYDCKDAATSVFEELPSAQPERKKGKWISVHDDVFADRYYCSCCKTEPICSDTEYVLSNFCPNCGADMRCE